tara:strand:- start:82 stop:471 length:390 start_codon:yes stop_codon:yes gene_type:complete
MFIYNLCKELKMNKEQIIEKVKEAALNKVVQIVGGILVSMVLGFASGRSSVSVPEKDVICFDYKEDIKRLSAQLDKARADCISEKRRLANKVRNEMEQICNDRVRDAIDDAEFNSDIHCPICVARGYCQ